MTYLRLFEESSQADLSTAQIDVEAKKFAILAIRVPEVIDFEEIFQLKAFASLQQVNLFNLSIS